MYQSIVIVYRAFCQPVVFSYWYENGICKQEMELPYKDGKALFLEMRTWRGATTSLKKDGNMTIHTITYKYDE